MTLLGPIDATTVAAMTKWFHAVLALLVLGGAASAADTADVFAAGKLWPVHITLSPEEFAAIQPRGGGFPGFGPQPKNAPLDPKREVHKNQFGMILPWGVGTVTVGEHAYGTVGIRFKGNGTIGDASRTIKKSIKIDLDRAGGDGRFGGSRTINLHCGVTDPSKCREMLGYELYRAVGTPAPRTALAEVRLTVPGKHDKQLLGLYTIVEEVDKPFLRDRFGDDKGLLMKPEGLREFEDRGDSWDRYKTPYAPKRDASKDEAARMIAFAKLVHKADDATFSTDIGSYLDVDAYLRFLAATAFVANSDSFFVLGHNYCMYLHPKTKKLHFLPWDLDRAFANFPILGSNSQQMDMSMTHPYAGTHRLTERLLAMPDVRDRYAKLLKTLSETAFSHDQLAKRLAAAEAAVKEPRERDAKAAVERKDGVGGFPMFGKPPGLKTFIEKRSASVAAQVAGTSKGFLPVAGFGMGGPPKLGVFMASPMMEFMDKNGDEKLAREEWTAAVKKVFETCQADAEKKLDVKSLTAGLTKMIPPPDGAPPGGFNIAAFMAGAILARADANKDGKLTAEELQAAAASVFDDFDKKKAGKLDEDAFAELLTAVFPAPKFQPPPKEKDKP
jgi:spore coat protein CotH